MLPMLSGNSTVNIKAKEPDYTIVTEIPANRGSQEQITRLYARYRFASEYCKNKDVLEVACGAGIGLGYLAKFAHKVVGGDIDENNLKFALETYNGRSNIEILPLDAHSLSFDNDSFDVVILYEAIYYLPRPEEFLDEARRVLRSNGSLIICTANKDWPGFNPSPYSYRYFSASELYSLLKNNGFDVELFADCPVLTDSFKDKLVSIIKKTTVKLHLIPKTMKGKEKFKRLFFGKLVPLPPEITDDMGIKYSSPVSIPHDNPITRYKVLFALAHARKM